jgi:hypothetical protein
MSDRRVSVLVKGAAHMRGVEKIDPCCSLCPVPVCCYSHMAFYEGVFRLAWFRRLTQVMQSLLDAKDVPCAELTCSSSQATF